VTEPGDPVTEPGSDTTYTVTGTVEESTEALPHTGSGSSAPLGAAGLLLVTGGAGLLRLGRRR
jgi:LPXTG-motif cell wall-anchored protein